MGSELDFQFAMFKYVKSDCFDVKTPMVFIFIFFLQEKIPAGGVFSEKSGFLKAYENIHMDPQRLE